MEQKSNQNQNTGRVIGLDAHPDSFTAALIRGETPAQALTEKIFNKLPLAQLENWAKKHLHAEDIIVLEASGNSFAIVRSLRGLGLRAEVLDSTQLGKLKEAHANNDKISAVRIGKAYLAGTAKIVWVPDECTQQHRDWHHSYFKAVKRSTQLRNRLRSYLSDNKVRLEGLPLANKGAAQRAHCERMLKEAKQWSPRQWMVIEGLLMELRHAEEQRRYWRRLIAQEVLADPLLLSLVRLCGVRDVIAFALGAIIGDISRFAEPRKLVGYVGLSPAFDDSGEGTWSGGVGGHGRRDLRGLLNEAAQSILRSNHPLAKWGKKLLARKSQMKLAVAAVARKLTVAIWYLMSGRWSACEEVDSRTQMKLGKIIGELGAEGLKLLGKTRKELREEAIGSLKTGRTYILRPSPVVA